MSDEPEGVWWFGEIEHPGDFVEPRGHFLGLASDIEAMFAELIAVYFGFDHPDEKYAGDPPERTDVPKWNKTPIGSITRPAVKTWFAKLSADGVSAGTLKNIRNTLSAVFASAIDSGLVTVNPVSGLKLARPQRSEKIFLDAVQVQRLADAVDEPYGLLVTFAAYTGLRAGEIAALRWERVDLQRGTIDVVASYAEVHGALVLGETKTYARRTVALPPFLVEQLGELAQDEGLVFTAADGSPLRQSNFYARTFKPAVKAAGLPEALRFHDLRHTCVALLVEQGAHPLAIKERLGHSSITVTLDTYGSLLPSLDESLTDGLDETYRAARERSAGIVELPAASGL